MDKIVVMKDGRISEQGTYHQILKTGGEFVKFLVEYLAEEEDQVWFRSKSIFFCVIETYKKCLFPACIFNLTSCLWVKQSSL